MSAREGKASVRMAWIESPFQLLNAVEYAVESGERVLVVPRRGSRQLDETIETVRRDEPSNVEFAPARRWIFGVPAHARASFLIGDIYSGQFRAYATIRRIRNLVVVDDGTATLHLASSLADAGRGLSRASARESIAMRLMGRRLRSRLRGWARSGSVKIFSGYAHIDRVLHLETLGFHVQANRYTWLPTITPNGEEFDHQRVVLGTALVATGQIRSEAFLAWVREQADEGPAAYYPHRRETESTLAEIREMKGISVLIPSLPIEFLLAGRSTIRSVSTLPTSAVRVLSSVLPHTRITVTGVPMDWWVPGAERGLNRAFDEIGLDSVGAGGE